MPDNLFDDLFDVGEGVDLFDIEGGNLFADPNEAPASGAIVVSSRLIRSIVRPVAGRLIQSIIRH